ncbi:PKD domain-containing protein [Methanoregula sp.]|uniref:PKD domain-containing protein n=1 Tax=Methanoregula sp. TaxID=2052170 RepID=UPI0025E81FFC|nr:PKD domain-containing protein [Methanoregula sp.]
MPSLRMGALLLLLCLVLMVVPAMATTPTASFTATPRQGLAPLAVQFTDTSTGSPTLWSWDFNNDGTVDSTAQNPSNTFTSTGTYTISLTVTNGDGSTSVTKNGYIAVMTQAPLSDFRFINIYVANDEGVKRDVSDGVPAEQYLYIPNTYFVSFDTLGGGLNAPHITNDVSTGKSKYGTVFTTRNQSGTFWYTFTGGQPTMHEGILMLAVNGTIPDDFSVHIRSSGDDWALGEPGTENLDAPSEYTYVEGAVDQSFTKSDFFYGPQSWKPSSSPGYPIYSGEDQTDPANQFHLMFIDLRSGITGHPIKIEYSFNNLTSLAAFNVYGWYVACSHGTGIIMTNDVTGSSGHPNGYMVLGIPDKPVADFMYSTANADITSPVQFTDTSTNIPQEWSWNFGDGSTSTEQSPSHTYASVGTYDVTLTIKNIKGTDTVVKPSAITKAHLAIPEPAFVANVTSGVSPCLIQFTDKSTGTVISRLWDFGDGTTSTSLNPVHWYAPGTYLVNLTVANTDGSKSFLNLTPITVSPNGRYNQVDNSGFETGDLTGWDPYVPLTGGLAKVVTINPHQGTYDVNLINRRTNITQYVDLTNVSEITWWALSNSEGGEKTNYIYLDNLKSSLYRFSGTSWKQFSYTIPQGYSGIHAFKISQYTSETYAHGTLYDNITAIPHPTTSFSATPVNGRVPLTVQFTDSSTVFPSSWSWDFGDGDSTNATKQNPIHTFTKAGNYTVKLTAGNDGGTDTSTQNGLVSVTDFSGAIPAYTGVNVHVANDNGAKWNSNLNGTYYVTPNSGGLSAIHISNYASNNEGQFTTTKDQSGTLYITDTSGGKFQDEAVLLLAVNGTIPDEFSVRIRSSGYTWTPNATANNGPSKGQYTYQVNALDETFTRDDFIYGPQSWKPTGLSTRYPLFYGENMDDPKNQYLLMFIDTRAGVLGPEYAGTEDLIGDGAVKVQYDFSYLPSHAAFNVYAWKNASSNGRGMGWTNMVEDPDDGSGWVVVSSIPVAPVANFKANQTEGIAPFNVKFKDRSTNTPTAWLWKFGDGNTSHLQNPAFMYNISGTYSVSLTASNLGGSNTSTKSGYITVSEPVTTTNTFALTGVTTGTSGSAQTIALNVTNSTNIGTGNVFTVTNVSSSWDHFNITLDASTVNDNDDGNVTGTVKSVEAVAANITVPLESLGRPNVTLSLTLSKLPDTTSSITSTVTSDPDTSAQSSFTAAATDAKKQIVATAYTVTFAKTGIENAAVSSSGIIQSATITMAIDHTWVANNGGTGSIVIMHRSDAGKTTVLDTSYNGIDPFGNDIFTAYSPTGLSMFVLTAVTDIPPTGTPSSSSRSSGNTASADAAARENAAFLAAMIATPTVTPTPTATPEPTATPVPTPTPKLKVRITPWPTQSAPGAQQNGDGNGNDNGVAAAESATAPGSGSAFWKNPWIFAAETIAAIAILTTSIAAYVRRRGRRRDPLRWDYK